MRPLLFFSVGKQYTSVIIFINLANGAQKTFGDRMPLSTQFLGLLLLHSGFIAQVLLSVLVFRCKLGHNLVISQPHKKDTQPFTPNLDTAISKMPQCFSKPLLKRWIEKNKHHKKKKHHLRRRAFEYCLCLHFGYKNVIQVCSVPLSAKHTPAPSSAAARLALASLVSTSSSFKSPSAVAAGLRHSSEPSGCGVRGLAERVFSQSLVWLHVRFLHCYCLA